MTVAEWLALAKADAEKRGLPDLIPALDGLAKATAQLRAADWNDAADLSTRSSLSENDNDDLAHPSTPLGVTLSLSKGQGGHK
jgi:hypothetical protein